MRRAPVTNHLAATGAPHDRRRRRHQWRSIQRSSIGRVADLAPLRALWGLRTGDHGRGAQFFYHRRFNHPADFRPLRLGVRPAMLISATYALGKKVHMAGRSAAGNAANLCLRI